MFCFAAFLVELKWTKFLRRRRCRCTSIEGSFHFCPPKLSSAVDVCSCIHTLWGCLVFGYFEAHIGRSFEHKLNVGAARVAREKVEWEPNYFHVCMASPKSTISHHLLFETPWNSLLLSNNMNEKDRSVSNNDDVVHVLDKAKQSKRRQGMASANVWKARRWVSEKS